MCQLFRSTPRVALLCVFLVFTPALAGSIGQIDEALLVQQDINRQNVPRLKSNTSSSAREIYPNVIYREPQALCKDSGESADIRHEDVEAVVHSAPQDVESASTPKDNENPSAYERTLSNAVFDFAKFMQDGLHTRSLFSELAPSGGAKLLQDLALRTRSFQAALKAWEDLHLEDEDGMLRERRVLQRLWASKTPDITKAIGVYDEFRVFLTRIANKLFPWTSPSFADLMTLHASFGGRGLVFTTGDNQAQYLMTSIPAMRELGCDLPIEIMYLGDDDLKEENREMLETLPNVVTRNMGQMINDEGWAVKGWAAKPFAMLFSSFREVIFIDADALFFQNPEDLFLDSDYVRTGALFFRDRVLSPESKRNLLREILPKPISQHMKQNGWWTGKSGHVQDSGVVVLDKTKHFVPLLLTTRLNGPDRDTDHDKGRKGIYELMYGDKETFWLSWEMAGSEDYAFHKGTVGTMGGTVQIHTKKRITPDETEGAEDANKDAAEICSPQLLHLDLNGRPLWFNGWVAINKSDKKVYKPFSAFMKEPEGVRDPWTLKESNVACLKAEVHQQFTEMEQRIIDGILSSAQRNQKG